MAALPNEGADINYWGVPIPVQPANPSSYNDGFDSLRIERQVQYQRVCCLICHLILYEFVSERGIVDNLAVAQAARYANRVPEIAQPRTFTARARSDTNTFLAQWVVELQQTLNYVQHMLNNMQQKFRNLEQRQNKTCALVVRVRDVFVFYPFFCSSLLATEYFNSKDRSF